jgi:DNA-binding NarL/FixJ family response regulator
MSTANYTIKVSLVEDNQFIRTAIEQIILGSKDFQLASIYESAEEAVEKIPLDKPDVVLMDINLGAMSGTEAIRILKERCPDIKFMMCTVYEDDENIFEALAAGASGYILKKSKSLEILSAIKDLYEGGAPMSGQIASRVVASFRKKAPVQATRKLEDLSDREFEILEALVHGKLYKEIADSLFISIETVRKHVYNIYKKLHVNNRVEAYNKFYGKTD